MTDTLKTAGEALDSADKLKELISRQAVEIEKLRKDAERYRWLRKSHHDSGSAIGVTKERMNGWGRISAKSLRNSELAAVKVWPNGGHVGWTDEDTMFYGEFSRAIIAAINAKEES